MLKEGILLGLALSVLVGPVFFILLRLTIEKGSRAALFFCTGVWVSDFIYMSLAYFGMNLTHAFLSHLMYRRLIGFVGSAILLIFGLAAFLSKEEVRAKMPQTMRAGNILLLFSKGFFVNSFNPFLLLFWMGVMAALGDSIESNRDFWWFAAGFYGTIILTDLLKIYLSRIIRHKMKTRYILFLRRAGGIILMIFGVVLLIRTLHG